MVRLFHLFSDATYHSQGSVLSGPAEITVGSTFHTDLPIWLTRIGWFRSDVGSVHKPTHLGIFDADTNELVWATSNPADDDGFGWIYTKIVGGFLIPAGHNLHAVGRFLEGANIARFDMPDVLPHFPRITYRTGQSKSTTSAWPAPPVDTQLEPQFSIDVQYQESAPDTATPTVQDLQEQFDDYFGRQTANANPNQQALYARASEAALGGSVMAPTEQNSFEYIESLIGGVNSGLTTVVTPVMDYLRAVLGTEAEFNATDWKKLVAALTTILGLLEQGINIGNGIKNLIGTPPAGNDLMTEILDHRSVTEGYLADLVNNLRDDTQSIHQWLGHGNGSGTVPTIVAETDFLAPFTYYQDADFYIVDIYDVPPNTTDNSVGGWNVWFKIGHCATVMDGGALKFFQRLTYGTMVVSDHTRYHGILIASAPGVSGHVTAYQYLAP